MLLSEQTVSVLKNFNSINNGLFFKKGNVLRTVNGGKTIMAEAVIDEEIPSDFGIHELSQLLSIISLHKTPPELIVNGNNLVVKGTDGKSKITYRCCSAEMIKMPPDKKLELPSKDLTFTLESSDLDWIVKSSSVLSAPNIFVASKDGKLQLGAYDSQNDSAHTDTVTLQDYTGSPLFVTFKTENWKMVPGTYDVTLSTKGMAHFQHTERKIQYWLALESKKA